jgi:hypothetical protein
MDGLERDIPPVDNSHLTRGCGLYPTISRVRLTGARSTAESTLPAIDGGPCVERLSNDRSRVRDSLAVHPSSSCEDRWQFSRAEDRISYEPVGCLDCTTVSRFCEAWWKTAYRASTPGTLIALQWTVTSLCTRPIMRGKDRKYTPK